MAKGILGFASVVSLALATVAEAQSPPPYGPAISLEQAKTIAAAAVAEVPKAASNPDVIVILDSGAHLVYLERMDNAQIGSIRVALDKARSAVLHRRPTKDFAEAFAKGRTALLGLHGASILGGGVPIIDNGKLIGAIGVSGGTSPGQDDKVAAAGLATLK